MKKREYSLYTSEHAGSVRRRYIELLHQGKTGGEAADILQKLSARQLEEPQYRYEFWLALADTMWNYGRLTDQVKANALEALRLKRKTLAGLQDSCPRIYASQTRFLGRLEEKLNSQQPETKRVAAYQLFTVPWEEGDVLAHRLSPDAGELADRLVFAQVVRKQSYWPGHMVPVVRVFRRTFDRLPDLEELAGVGYLPQFWGPSAYDRRLDAQYPYTVRMHNVLYNMLLSASSAQEYQMFEKAGSLPLEKLELDRVSDVNESTCRLFEVETLSALKKWGDTDVYALLGSR